MEPLLCEWDVATLLVFSDNVFSPLIYYSHIGPLVVSLLLGSVVLFNNPKRRINQALFAITVLFSLWVYIDLVLWASEKPEYIMFFWSIIVPIELMLYAACWYLAYLLAYGRMPGIISTGIVFIIFLPLFLFTHTSLNLLGFDYTNCDREAIEGPLVQYLYFMELVFIGWIIGIGARGLRRLTDHTERNQLMYVTIGTVLFLLVFSVGNILVSYFLEVDWSYEQYKLFGMPVFAAFIAYTAIRFKSFDLKIFTAQVLVVALAILVVSMAFLQSLQSVHVIAVITFILVCALGYSLVRSVKREIREKERNEVLAKDLAKANIRLRELDKLKSEFVSIASHQLRSPLTAIRGYASMLSEGSFGAIPEKAKEPIQRIEESSRFMALSVDDFLNVSRIESGSMKYEKATFSLSKVASDIADNMRPAAMKKGLVIVYRSDAEGDMHVNADEGKVRQIIQNIVDNAMKYTPKGTITIVAQEDTHAKRARVLVADTGVGMSEETAQSLFGKFVRAKNANAVNVYGTGLGLYIARQMTEAMGGTLTARSDGEGKGSTFTFELPLEA